MKLGISEIMKLADEAESQQEKVEILQKHKCPGLLRVLRAAYHPDIEWHLPNGKVPYTPWPHPEAEGALHTESRRIYLFITGPGERPSPLVPAEDAPPELKRRQKIKREQLFIAMLESVDQNDAALLVAAKDKKLPYKSLQRPVIRKAFPGLIDA